MIWQRFIEDFNEGNTNNVLRYFNNDIEDFFSVLKSKNLFHLLDPTGRDSSEWQNQYLSWLLENDKPAFNNYMNQLLGDVEIDEKGDSYLVLDNRGELSILFCDHRDISQKTVESILEGDSDWFEHYWDTTDDVYRDVIQELNDENLQILYNRIIKDLENQRVETETEELELIASEQGHPDYVEVNQDNIARIVDDEETMNELLNKYLDIKSDLYSIHSNAWNSAMESEIYKDIWNELDDFFYEGEWISKPHPFKENTTVYKFKVKIRDFESHISDFLTSKYANAISDEGYFLRILAEQIDCLSPRISDYPSSGDLDRLVNEYFGDYI